MRSSKISSHVHGKICTERGEWRLGNEAKTIYFCLSIFLINEDTIIRFNKKPDINK